METYPRTWFIQILAIWESPGLKIETEQSKTSKNIVISFYLSVDESRQTIWESLVHLTNILFWN